jgi:CheY-like chemotaxis protein
MAPRHYLLVDDNRPFADNLAEILRDLGAEATVAESGEEALSAVRRTRFSAVLTDMRMPAMGGAAVVHALRKVDPGLPALAITAYSGDAELGRAIREGLLAVLPKPVPIPVLLQQLWVARRGGLVALVEDDPSLAENLVEALRGRGFAAVTARSVLETEQLASVRPCAALVDLRVPGGKDGAALERLRARFPEVPVLVITAHDDPLAPIPHATVFHKPFSTQALLDTLEALWREANP